MGTLLPKESNCCSDYATVVARRAAVNDWIRHQAQVDGVIDFEAVLAQPGNINSFAAGLGEDGIHPSVAGQRLMGQEAAKVLSPLVRPHIEAVSPASGTSSGGTALAQSDAKARHEVVPRNVVFLAIRQGERADGGGGESHCNAQQAVLGN